jgi:hypothetical protein
MKNNKLLVVVDESPATRKALEYVARIAARRTNFQICLAHSLLAPPRELIEFRGPENRRLRAYKSRWISAVEMTEQRALVRANAVLRRGGLANGAIEAHFCYLVDGTRATSEILRCASATPWFSGELRSLGSRSSFMEIQQKNLSTKVRDSRSG